MLTERDFVMKAQTALHNNEEDHRERTLPDSFFERCRPFSFFCESSSPNQINARLPTSLNRETTGAIICYQLSLGYGGVNPVTFYLGIEQGGLGLENSPLHRAASIQVSETDAKTTEEEGNVTRDVGTIVAQKLSALGAHVVDRLILLDIGLTQGAAWEFALPHRWVGFVYVGKGVLECNATTVREGEAALLSPGDNAVFEADTETRLFISCARLESWLAS